MLNNVKGLLNTLLEAIEEQEKAYDEADTLCKATTFEFKHVTIAVNGHSFEFEYGSDLVQTMIETTQMKLEYDLDLTDLDNMPCDNYGLEACTIACPQYFECHKN